MKSAKGPRATSSLVTEFSAHLFANGFQSTDLQSSLASQAALHDSTLVMSVNSATLYNGTALPASPSAHKHAKSESEQQMLCKRQQKNKVITLN